jgi:hypothetical protein
VLIIGPRSRPSADGLVMGRVVGLGWTFLVLSGIAVERPKAGGEPSDLGTSWTSAVVGRAFA